LYRTSPNLALAFESRAHCGVITFETLDTCEQFAGV
jgi:hypothetical protein